MTAQPNATPQAVDSGVVSWLRHHLAGDALPG